MAKIVLGLATPHSPQLSIPASQWPLLQEKDETDPRLDYAALLRRAPAHIKQEITPEKMQERDEASQKAVAALAAVLKQAAPDVILAVGDDQHEQFLEDNMPMFCVYRGKSLPMGARNGRRRGDPGLHSMASAWQAAERHQLSELRREYDAEPELAEHLIRRLVDEGFDVSCTKELKADVGLGHAFTFIFRRLIPEGIPMVPFMINDFYPPNTPTSRRCYALGQALRRAVESWEADKRVAIVASGGLSHVIIDEELDRATLDAALEKDPDRLCALPEERMTLGTSENRNWIALAGAMEPMEMLLAQYIPCYRSPAGTGCAMGFAYWM